MAARYDHRNPRQPPPGPAYRSYAAVKSRETAGLGRGIATKARVVQPARMQVATPSSAPFGRAAAKSITKSAYLSPSGHSTFAFTSRKRTPQDITAVHPVLAPRPQTPPGGHFYEINGVLYPLDAAPDRDSPDHHLDRAINFPHRHVYSVGQIHAGGSAPRKQLASKARQVHASSSDTESSSSYLDSEESESEPEERTKEIIVISTDSESSDSSTDEELTSLLTTALGPLVVPVIMHIGGALPFLARNLRQAFLGHCQQFKIPTFPRTSPEPSLRVTYRFRLAEEDDWEEFYGSRTEWRCPMCDLHGAFNTREMLAFHLGQDHPEVHSTWLQVESNSENGVQWLILVEWTTSQLTPPTEVDPETATTVESLTPDLSVDMEDDRDKVTVDLSRQFENVSIQPINTRAADNMPRLKCEEEAENILLTALTQQQERLATHENPLRPPQPRTGITEDGKLIPPPKNARYGPAAEPPLESCRPGGPRLYDHLNELPLEPFGVMAWAIIHTEDETFEQEDLPDKDKVMLALWNRWIMLNRDAFVFGDRYVQVTNFLDEYYVMIHRAAGWDALRQFLLVLLANKFLTISHVTKLIKHYEKRVDMVNWYKDEGGEPSM
ncbi:hypothetical protein BC835DRAFT_650719 [Cytidiella melzeri]|nr:hypothetical protein BC835DRAFT_650719 [Cytidiella melzeri]